MEPITSYAQNFEDVMLWRALGHVPDGMYIDIGAQSPLVDSVSMGFFEKGWRGIHVDANPAYVDELRKGRPGDIVIEAVISGERGMASFHAIEGTGLSTVDPDVAKAHLDGRGFQSRVMPVPQVTLDDVFALVPAGDVHWLKIDVEGAEGAVLGGWQCDCRPWVVVVESVHPVTRAPTQAAWEHLLFERGYEFVYADGLNRFYLHAQHADLSERFDVPPNVFDLFRLSGTATSSFAALLNERAVQEQLAVEARQRDEFQRALQEKEAVIAELGERIAQADQDRTRAAALLETREAELLQLRERSRVAEQERARLDGLLTSLELKERELLRLRERAEAGDSERMRVAASLELSAQELLHLQQQVQLGEAERSRLAASLEFKERELLQLRGQAEAGQSECSRLAATLGVKELELVQLRERAEGGERQCSRLAASVEIKEHELLQFRQREEAGERERQRLGSVAEQGRQLSRQLAAQVSSMLQISLEATRAARAADAERDALATQLLEARRKLAGYRSEVDSIAAKAQGCQNELVRVAGELEATLHRQATLEKQIQDIFGSTSWRTTAPLRLLSRLLRGDLGYVRSAAARSVARLDPDGVPRRTLRWLLPTDGRLGQFLRRKLRGALETPVERQSTGTRIEPAGGSPDLRRLLELTGVVTSKRGKL